MAVSVMSFSKPQERQEIKQKEPDFIDQILRGLQIASSIYGIKHNISTDELNQLKISAEKTAQEQAKLAQDPSAAGNVVLRKELEGIGSEIPEGATGQQLGLSAADILKLKAAQAYKVKPDTDTALDDLKKEKIKAEIEKMKTPKPTTAEVKPEKTSVGQSAVDRAFAKTYEDWVAAGGSEAVNNQLGELDAAKQILKDNPRIVGPLVPTEGKTAELVNPQALVVRDKVLKAIQASLRATLGAQFTEREAEQFFKRSYNGNLSAEENIAKIDAAIKSLRDMAIAKDQSARYFEQYGTLKGFSPKAQSVNKEKAPEADVDAKSIESELIKRKGIAGIKR